MNMATNKDQFIGNWKQLKGEVKRRWGKLTDDEIDQIEGNREKLLGRIQENYGIMKEEAQKQIDAWEETSRDTDQIDRGSAA